MGKFSETTVVMLTSLAMRKLSQLLGRPHSAGSFALIDYWTIALLMFPVASHIYYAYT